MSELEAGEKHMDVQTVWFQDGTKSRTVLDAGSYQGTLIAIKPGKRPSFDGQGEKLCLSFIFETESGARVSRMVTASRDDRSTCMVLIRSMAGAHQPTSDIISDAEQFQNFLSGWIGQIFLLQVEPSKCGQFSNLSSASAVPNDGGLE